jgi:hypothetical protein
MPGVSLLFRADGRLCALGLEYVSEIMRPVPVVPMAGAPPFVRGVCVIRGVPTPVVDTAALVGAGGRGLACFVIVKGGRYPAALAVDEVLGVGVFVCAQHRGAIDKCSPFPAIHANRSRRQPPQFENQTSVPSPDDTLKACRTQSLRAAGSAAECIHLLTRVRAVSAGCPPTWVQVV